MNSNVQFVEFFGGPLDGYRRMVPGTPDTLAPAFELDVGESTFRIMAKMPHSPATVATSTAIYELVWVDALPRYYFVGAVAPVEKRFAEH